MEAPISMRSRLWIRLIYAVSVFRRFSTRYFCICHFFLRYCGIGYPPMSPSSLLEQFALIKRVEVSVNKAIKHFKQWWMTSTICKFGCVIRGHKVNRPTSRDFGAQGTTHNDLHGEAPPERGTFSRLQVYKRVGISLVKYSNSPRIRTWIFQFSLNRFLYKWYLKQI